MAQYDGAIRIVTKITTKDAKESLHSLEYTIKKSAKEIDSLRSKMDALKNQKIPTKEWKDLEKELSESQKELSDLIKTRDEWADLGVNSGLAWEDINQKIKSTSGNIDLIKEKMQALTNAGKDFTLGKDTAEYKGYERQIEYEEKAITEAGRHYKALLKTKEGYENLKKTATSALQKIGSTAKKTAIAPFKMIGNVAKNAFSNISKSAKKSGGMLSTFGSRFKSLALSLLIFNQISKVFNAMISGIKEGFSNLYNENMNFKSSVDSLQGSLLTLKNALAGAFAPIVQAAIPYIQQLISWITSAVEAVGQFIAALTGRKTYIKAVQQTAGAFEDAARAANDAKEAAEGYLSPLDEINKYDDGKDKGASSGGGGGGAGGAGQMFEEVPVESRFEELAKKVKDIFSQIFSSLKEAWDREGKFVMDSWKYALDEVWKLAKDIGRDFLKVWNQEATISMLADILHIIGDIGQVVGNLAGRFREAWNTNDIGLHILENIRDIFAIIVSYIRSAADYTVEWSKKLDFYPLLESINGLLEALKPLTDNIGAGLEWFYKNVLLPIAGWTIQEAIPAFLDMLAAAIYAVNQVIEVLKPLGTWLWENFLQPLGKWAGETIIAAMTKITDLLTKLGDWISNHSEAVQNFVIVIGSFAAAWKLVTAAITIWNGIAAIASTVTTALGAAISFLASPIGIAVAAIGAIIAIGVLLYKNWDTIKEKAEELKEWLLEKWEAIRSGIGDVIDGIIEGAKQLIPGIIEGIKSGWDSFINWLGDLWDGIVESFKSFFGIHSPSKLMAEMGGYLIEGLLNGIKSLAGNVKQAWDSMKQTAVQTWETVKKDLGDKWEQIKTNSKATFNNIAGNIRTSWDNIKSNVKTAVENAKNNIVTAWKTAGDNTRTSWESMKSNAISAAKTIASNVKSKYSEIKDAVRSFSSSAPSLWRNAWTSMGDKVSSVLDTVKRTVSNVFSWISNSIKNLGNSLKSLASKASSVGKSGSSSANSSNARSAYSAPSPYATHSAMAAVDTSKIPGYATGQVIPARMKQHLAILGDNNRETEVVSPLSTIKQANKESLLEVLSELGLTGNKGNGKGNIYSVKAEANRKVLFELMIEEGKLQQMSSGRNPFLLNLT